MFVLLWILIFVYHVAYGFYQFHGWETLPTLNFLYRGALVCGVVWWLRSERRHSAVTSMYCQGLLVGIAYQIIIPYHLFKTRGLRGFIPLLALMGSPVAGRVTSMFVYLSLPN